jgi:hypothetical protein
MRPQRIALPAHGFSPCDNKKPMRFIAALVLRGEGRHAGRGIVMFWRTRKS